VFNLKKIGVIIIFFLIVIAFSTIVYSDQDTIGVFNVSNVLPSAPSSWQPITTHNKSENFTWTQPVDSNGDPITTYVCITNDTDVDTCSVVFSQTGSNEFSYKFDQSENFWDYAPFGTASRSYYVKLTPNDGIGNGTVNDTISFTLTNAVPTVTGQTSNASNDGDIDVGETIQFNMSSHGDTDTVDNHSLRVCKTDSITTSGTCAGGEYCNEYGGTYSNDNDLSCTYVAQESDSTSNTAYFFVCDCPPFDQSCPGQCNPSGYAHTFYVNHAPNATSVDEIPDSPASNDDLNCSFTFSDPDGDGPGTHIFQWYNWTGSSWDPVAGATSQILPSSYTVDGQVWMCSVIPVDEHGFPGPSVNGTNETIWNAPPNQPNNFDVQDGASSFDSTHNPYIDTHDVTPFLRWNATDDDGESVSMYVCIATTLANRNSNICDANFSSTTASNITILSGLDHNGTLRHYFVRLTPNDGSENGTVLDTNFTLINNIPDTPNTLSPTNTHDQTPDLSWVATDSDTGGVDQWPADTLTYHITVGTSFGDGTYENNNNANKAGETVDNPIPWGPPGAVYSNTTVYVTIWTTDGNTGGISTTYNVTLSLLDFLADIMSVEMTNHNSAYSTCTNLAGGCALNPVEGTNTTVAVRLIANDTDQDCDTTSTADIYLCTFISGTCDPSTYNYTWTVNDITRAGDICTYTFSINKTASDNTPEFFRWANDSYLLHVNITSQGGRRTSDTERDRLWEYSILKAINYPDLVIFGGGTPVLGQWNNGTDLALMTNFGNVFLGLDWNTTDPTSGSDTWPLDGTDLMLDDDNITTTEPEPIAPIFMNGTRRVFQPAGGLGVCTESSCSDTSVNETMDTFYHANPPFGLQSGTYNSTITIEIS